MSLNELKSNYIRAIRFWKSNNLNLCLQACDLLTDELADVSTNGGCQNEHDLMVLRQLIWSLKIKCLSENFYISEALLLNEDDLESENQVLTFKANSGKVSSLSRQISTISRPMTGKQQSRFTRGSSALNSIDQLRSGMITGHLPVASTRQRSTARSSSSHRPLTTGLTASKVAFSRSTQPLLRYATNRFLAKSIYHYLYNVQRATNFSPDYRQCLEYLNNVNQQERKQHSGAREDHGPEKSAELLVELLDDSESSKDAKRLAQSWLLAFGCCYYNLRMNSNAVEYFEAARRANPKQLDPHLWLIKIHLRLNEPIRVLRICDEALERSKNPIIFNWRARIQSLLGDKYAAHASLRRSLDYCPTNIEALANVGHFSFYEDKLDKALKCFERINQLTSNQAYGSGILITESFGHKSSCELLNNLALCNLYSGNVTSVIPLFRQAFLSSPSRETTSNIWYNLSFVPLNFGFLNMAMTCLDLAISNDSQNVEAINNLGVLKFASLINSQLHYENRQEIWSAPFIETPSVKLENQNQHYHKWQMMYDEAESHFIAQYNQVKSNEKLLTESPEMLYNMALVKHKRGQFLSSLEYCKSYLEFDRNNYSILRMIHEIEQLICM